MKPCKFFHKWSEWRYRKFSDFGNDAIFNANMLKAAFNNPYIRMRDCSACGTVRMDLFEGVKNEH